MLTYLLPSVVDISGAGIKWTVVINKKRLQNKNETKYCNLATLKELRAQNLQNSKHVTLSVILPT